MGKSQYQISCATAPKRRELAAQLVQLGVTLGAECEVGEDRDRESNMGVRDMRDKLTIEIFDANGDSETIDFPAKWEICPCCEGCGTDRGASVECDGGGFTSSEWAEQADDFKEGYLRGDYDRPCVECRGHAGRVQVVDRDRADPESLALYDQHIRDELAAALERRAERRMAY